MERVRLDRRRVKAAHFKYAVCVASWYPSEIEHVPVFSPNLDQTLLEFSSAYQQVFHKKYSGMCTFGSTINYTYNYTHLFTCTPGHCCNAKDCGTVLVLDGNQKNNCPICAAEEAEYEGLIGNVKTGCILSRQCQMEVQRRFTEPSPNSA